MKRLNPAHLARIITPAPVKRIIKALITELPWYKQIIHEINDLKTHLEQNQDALLYEAKVLPLPPKHLQIRVVAGYFGDFIRSGYRTCTAMEEMLQTQVNS
jgi:hypothetical protein